MSTQAIPVSEGLGPIIPGKAETLLWTLVPDTLPLAAGWTRRTVEALPPELTGATGYRDLHVESDGRLVWYWPHSNAAERIEAYVWLGDYLKAPAYHQIALRYAEAMCDPYWGIYQGPEEDGRGLVWYWRDNGAYMTNYAIRVPSAFLELAGRDDVEPSRAEKYRTLAGLTGEQLLRLQQPTGVLREGWLPRSLPAGMPWLSPEEHAVKYPNYVTTFKINSRVGYVCRAFADMWKATGDLRYLDALDLMAQALEKYQNADGSIPENLRSDRIEPFSEVRKGHFHHYILAGVAKTAMTLPDRPALRRITDRLADFTLKQYRHTGGTPYGCAYGAEPFEADEWRCARPESVPGLAWAAKATGNQAYREAAVRIALHGLLSMLNTPGTPDIHGGIPVWLHPSRGKAALAIDGFVHFWLILGLKALYETRMRD